LRATSLALLLAAAGSCFATCPPAGESRATLQALKASEWKEPADAEQRQALALALLDCLSDPDPWLRDAAAFDALQNWMRTGRLDDTTLRSLRIQLLALLAAPPDAAGFTQPFAALVLAEVARVDRLRGNLSDEERAALVSQGTRWLGAWRDVRAYDEQEGWRHGVAHGADLMLQLALNKRLQRPQADALLTAVASQVMPSGNAAWRHGEADRLAAPVFYLAQGPLLASADWDRWLTELAARRQRTPVNGATLAQKHNLSIFLNSLYVAVQEAGTLEVQARLLPGLRKALREAE
jgi:hypothetical protein